MACAVISTVKRTVKRTAPESWGEWPPSDERLAAVMARALRAVEARTRDELPGETFRTQAYTSGHFEHTYYNRQSRSVMIGKVIAESRRWSWLVIWHPETDQANARLYGLDPKVA